MKIYVAGPMRGYPQFNFPAFLDAAAKLRTAGHEVFSPAEHDMAGGFDPSGCNGSFDDPKYLRQGFSLREALCADLTWICTHADGVALLPGWEKSLGATAEQATALALGLGAWELDELLASPAPRWD